MNVARNRLRVLSGPTSRVWFVTEYEAPAYGAGPPPTRELPGLILHHQLDSQGDVICFIFYWQSREDFEASQTPLEEHLRNAKLRRAGWVRRLTVPKEPLWKRITVYGILLHVVAVLGALAALEKYYDWLLEEPMIALDLEETDPINLVQGAYLKTHLILTNQQATVTAEIAALEAKLEGPKNSVPLIKEGAYSIRERDSLELRLQSHALEAGQYRLKISGRARSGRLRGWRSLALQRNLRVWDQSPRIELALEPDVRSRRRLKVLLHVGQAAPAGLDCQATLIEEPSLRFGLIEFPGLENWPDPHVSREGSVSIQTWTTPSLPKFSAIPFFLYFDGQPADRWSRLRERVAVECAKRAGKDQV